MFSLVIIKPRIGTNSKKSYTALFVINKQIVVLMKGQKVHAVLTAVTCTIGEISPTIWFLDRKLLPTTYIKISTQFRTKLTPNFVPIKMVLYNFFLTALQIFTVSSIRAGRKAANHPFLRFVTSDPRYYPPMGNFPMPHSHLLHTAHVNLSFFGVSLMLERFKKNNFRRFLYK